MIHFLTPKTLTLAPGLGALVAAGCQAAFRAADLLREDDLPAADFDAIICFSVLEHIVDADGAARALARALALGGTLLVLRPVARVAFPSPAPIAAALHQRTAWTRS